MGAVKLPTVVMATALCILLAHECSSMLLRPGKVKHMSIPGAGKSSSLIKGAPPATGKATNCGKSEFSLTWTPKDVNPDNELAVTVNYTVPYDFSGGFVNASAYFHGDKEPFIGYADKVTCANIKKYFPVCPIKKGFHFHKSMVFPNVRKVGGFPGEYDFVGRVYNQKHEEMLCVKLTVTILSGRFQ